MPYITGRLVNKVGYFDDARLESGGKFLEQALAPKQIVKPWLPSPLGKLDEIAFDVLGLAAHGVPDKILLPGRSRTVSELTTLLKEKWVLLGSCNTLAHGRRVPVPDMATTEYDFHRPWGIKADTNVVQALANGFVGCLFGMSTLAEISYEKGRLFQQRGQPGTKTSLADRWLVSQSAGPVAFVPICVAAGSEDWLDQTDWNWLPATGTQNANEVYLEYLCWEPEDAIKELKLDNWVEEAKKKCGIPAPKIGYLIVQKFLTTAPDAAVESKVRWIVARNELLGPDQKPRVDFNGREEVWMRPPVDGKPLEVVESFYIDEVDSLVEEFPAKWPPDEKDLEYWIQLANRALKLAQDWRLERYFFGWRPVERVKKLRPFVVLLFSRSGPAGSSGPEAAAIRRVEIDLVQPEGNVFPDEAPGSEFVGRIKVYSP